MLFKLVDRTCTLIDRLPPVGVGEPALAQQIAKAAPDVIQEVITYNRKQGKKLSRDDAARVSALVAYTFIRTIPRLARAMSEKAQDRRVAAPRRAGIASVLAYLVQPHDIIPDDAPGQYGYLDDAILLHAGLVAYLDTVPGADASASVKTVEYLIRLTPPQARLQLQAGVASMSLLVEMLAMTDPQIAEATLMQIVANPLQASAGVAAPNGFTPRAARTYGGGHWSGGSYFEGNDVIIGNGGPALINGQVFIPD